MKTIYSKFFNLEMNPFGETPDPDFYYASQQHHQALMLLSAAIQQGKGFSLLAGEVGTGKTLLSRILLSSVTAQTNTALILFPKFTAQELLQTIIEEFEIPKPVLPLTTLKSYLDHLNQFLLTSLAQGRQSILIIDEAQAMEIEALEMIRLLTNLETKTQKLLQIVLIGQPELLETLNRPELRQLKQRVGLQASLQALDLVETGRYIVNRIEHVGNGNFVRFDSGAVNVIHALSGGMPRRINQICERVIVACDAKRVRLITSDLVVEILGGRPKGGFSLFGRKAQV